ncbi:MULTISPECIES: ATP synthase subunit C [Sedimentibacter]|uniref:ATP synthase subunit C n=1 Tax=Sedimentibacter TaxID=190972 RepID=UPI0002FAB21D|nr:MULTISPECIES: ATP synthase subunit C [Sedimentibacter]
MQILFIIAAAAVSIGTTLYGRKVMKSGKKGNIKKAILTTVSAFALIMIGAIVSTIFGGNVFAETAEATTEAAAGAIGIGEGLKYLSAALSTGIATIATGIAVGSVGSSAIGAISEDSSLLGKTLIFVGMSEGIAIYGLIISILILFV